MEGIRKDGDLGQTLINGTRTRGKGFVACQYFLALWMKKEKICILTLQTK